ncbi:MAG: GNAT family N-acetyltransferase [Actinomycetia bacterium]|nr:GNAT family N-acetyltransferase [Actinomycetes bacterium]
MEQSQPNWNKPERVYALLDKLGISYGRIDHPPIFTAADSMLRPVQTDAMIFKNLFLRNKDKTRYYLYSLPLAERADLAAVAAALGETRLSFGDERTLQEKLGIQHGAVSFLNAVGATDTNVSVLIDSSVFDYDRIGVHPNDNTATVVLRPQDIQRILAACDVEHRFLAPAGGDAAVLMASAEDAVAILRLQYAAYQSEALIYGNFSIQPLTQTLEQTAAELQSCVVLKAVLDGRIVGSVRAHEDSGTAYVAKLMVLPGYQNKGLGRRLLQAIEGEFPGRRFELYTAAQSEKNLALYSKCGYTPFRAEKTASEPSFVHLEKPAGGILSTGIEPLMPKC